MYKYRRYNSAVETEEEWWNRTQRWKAAYHEVGHAWVETHCGGIVLLVTIDANVHGNPNAGGLTETYGQLGSMPLMLMGFLAGKVCERLVIPRRLWSLAMMGAYRSDRDHARLCLKRDPGVTSRREQDKLLREAEAEVRALVADPVHRDEIGRLAEVLMEKRTLTGDQVRAIIKGHDYPL